jgi:energy-coupling factor transporter ATP-binding protein EcfA2
MGALTDVLERLLGPRTGREQAIELRFGTDLTQSVVDALLAALAGLPQTSVVRFETLATVDGIRHILRSDQATLDTVSGQLRALAPSTRIEPAPATTAIGWRMGARLSWSPHHPLLRVDATTETATGVLAGLNVAPGEALLLQVALRPGRPAPLPSAQSEGAGPGLFAPPRIAPHVLNGLRAKNGGPLVRCRVLLAVACGHPGRGAHLLGRVVSVFRARRGPHGHLVVRRLSARGVEDMLRSSRRGGGDLLSPSELAGLVAWPIGAPQIHGLVLGTSPLLPPDRRVPESGRLLGVSTWPATRGRALAQPLVGALSHTLICGPTGSGKSSLAANLIGADIKEGRGCLVLDGKGDLVADLLTNIPPDRAEDVIVLDPAGGGSVPGLRVFGHGSDPELAADLVLGVLREIFRDSWGVRSDQWLRAGLVTLAHDRSATLGDLPYIFTDDAYRQRLVGRIEDPLLLATWAAFEAMKPAERSNQLGAPLNKLTELLGRRVLRTVLSQARPALDMREAIRRNRIVLVSLSPGQLGTPAARLLGALVAHTLFSAVQARAAERPGRRKPFLAYIDEPKVLGDIPVPLDGLFELARGMGVGLTLTAQSLTQLPRPVRSAALTNAGTLVAFRQTADDAELLARELPGTTAEGLQHLGPFEMICRIGLGPGEVAAPTSGRTLPPPPVTSNPIAIRLASAERYGADPKIVDRELAQRHARPDATAADGPVGRRRRER